MEPALLVTLVAVAVAALLAAVAAVVLAGRRRLRAELAAARADVAAVQTRLDELARRVDGSPSLRDEVRDGPEFVITSLADDAASGDPVLDPDPRLVAGGQFVSVAAGESLVRVLSLAHGVRRALAAENRNRIRFEMRREVKRSRRQRRRDLKEAKRHLRTQHPDLSEDAA